MKIKISIILLLCLVSAHSMSGAVPKVNIPKANTPVLDIDQPQVFLRNLGKMTINAANLVDVNNIRIAGNVANLFDNQYLYSMSANGQRYWFRFNIAIYDAASNQTILQSSQWYNNKNPAVSVPVSFELMQWANERKAIFGRKLCTIGDSITWLGYGTYLRTLLRENGLRYDFGGNHIDTFGYRHCGNGGDTTVDMINRLNSLPLCDSYYILAGTNDVMYPDPHTTINNIMTMAKFIHGRNRNAIVNISTLLLRTDSNRPLQVNTLLRTLKLPPNTYLIDLQGQLPLMPAWKQYLNDIAHPNLAGYQLIAHILAGSIL